VNVLLEEAAMVMALVKLENPAQAEPAVQNAALAVHVMAMGSVRQVRPVLRLLLLAEAGRLCLRRKKRKVALRFQECAICHARLQPIHTQLKRLRTAYRLTG
jgi:hypothetical protein